MITCLFASRDPEYIWNVTELIRSNTRMSDVYQVCMRMVSVIQPGWRNPFMPACIVLQGETGRILAYLHSLLFGLKRFKKKPFEMICCYSYSSCLFYSY